MKVSRGTETACSCIFTIQDDSIGFVIHGQVDGLRGIDVAAGVVAGFAADVGDVSGLEGFDGFGGSQD